jgi:hypothetical protein
MGTKLAFAIAPHGQLKEHVLQSSLQPLPDCLTLRLLGMLPNNSFKADGFAAA